MTSRQLYESVLIELHKENAPNLLLEDFNYLANKAIYQYINKRYNIYDINQQTTDDLRVLKATALFKDGQVHEVDNYTGLTNALIGNNNQMATYYVDLPSDYLHMLNCICIYKVNKTYKCYNAGDTWRAAATRLTADAYSQVLDNFWMKPSYKRPYYYIHNINLSNIIPTNPYNGENGTDYVYSGSNTNYSQYSEYSDDDIDGIVQGYDSSLQNGVYLSYNNGYPQLMTIDVTSDPEASPVAYQSVQQNTIYRIKGTNKRYVVENNSWKLLNNNTTLSTDRSGNYIIDHNNDNMFSSISLSGLGDLSNVEKSAQVRYGNASKVRCEIRYGTDRTLFELIGVYIDYIKTPQHIRLTQEELDWTEDKSQMLEFPDYVCQEIVNELVHIVMENISDQRLQTHPVVSQSIANPAQAQAPETAG